MKEKFQKLGDFFKRRWLVNFTSTLVLIALVIAFYIGINILLENVVLPEIDCTESKIYSLSDETKDKVKNINKDVKITLINCSDYIAIINFADRYVELNNKIKIEKVDNLSARSDIMQKYALQPNDMALIITSGEREKLVSDSDMYTIDYTTYEEVDKTEEAITNAILDVTTDKKPKIYFMSSHIMYGAEYFSTIMQSIKDDAYEIENLDILVKGEIPSDCDCLMITTLKTDLNEKERDEILKYIKNGGNLLLLCGPNILNANLENFQKVLDEYGVSISNGVVFEGESSNMLAGYPDFILEEIQSSKFKKNSNSNLLINLLDAGKISYNEEKTDVDFEIIAQTSSKAFVRTNINQQAVERTSQDGEEGIITIAAMASKKIDDNKQSKLIVFSNEMFAMDIPMQLNGYTMYVVHLYNNEDMVLNSLAHMSDREDAITIRKKADDTNYTVTDEQDRIITIIIFTIPVLIMLEGIIIWIIRRKR